MASRSSTISKMLKERQQGIFEREQEKEGRQHGETKEVSTGRQGQDKTTMYWNANTQQWQKQYIRLKPPTGKEQDDRLRIAANEQKRAKIEAQRDTGDIFPDLRGGEGDIPAPVIAQKEEDDTAVIPQVSQTDEERANQDGKVQLIKKQNHDTAVLRNEQYLKSIAGNGMNNTYTSDYREAIKADTGWKAFYDDSPDSNDPVRRSDVFTRAEADWGMYKEGDILGVMGRSQRRAYDDAMHEAKMKSKHSLVQTPSPTWGVEGEKKSSKPNLVQTPSPTWGVGDGTPDPSVPAASEGKTIFDPDKNRKTGGS